MKTRVELDIDCDAGGDKKELVLNEIKKAFGVDRVLNVLTLKTEKTKSAVLTTLRGLGINNDDAQYISSLIEQERGFLFSLKDTWYGNEEKDRKPNTQFINEINRLSEKLGIDVKEALFMIEGIVSGYGSHACAINIYNEHFVKQNSMMVAPNGLPITCWEYHDSEEVGDLKFDALSTDAMSKLQLTMEYLLKDNVIQWQGTLRDTYNKYLHPDVVIEYDNPKMWEDMNKLAILSLFQFGDSEVGRTAMKAVKPTNIFELATANSLMRLMGEKGKLTPLEKYVQYKNDISLAYKEMDEYNLTKVEREVAKRLISAEYYLCSTQEGAMTVLMDSEVSNFTMRDADKARKTIGKKLMKEIPKLKESYFTQGREKGTSENFLNYMWDVCILPQLGYSFSILHTTGYSMIAMQEAFLATKYNPLYWACAVLTSNSGSIQYDEEGIAIEKDEDDEETEVDSDIVEEEVEVDTKKEKKKVTTNYDKMARAIGDLRQHGIIVSPPYINKAIFSFYPDIEGNQIVFGLKAIAGVGDELADLIVVERRRGLFTSLQDFINRCSPKKGEIIALIKAGAFDEFDTDRVQMMTEYIKTVVGVKRTLSLSNLNYLATTGLVPNEYKLENRLVKYKKYVTNKAFFYCIDEKTSKNKTPHKWFKLDSISHSFFNEYLISDCTEGREYDYTPSGEIIIENELLDKVIKKKLGGLVTWLNGEEATQLFNDSKFNAEWDKYCTGSISKWEMDSLSYYSHDHELVNVDMEKYFLTDFDKLNSEPTVVGETKYGKNTYPKYALSRIVGTVIGKNNTKHIVSILTTTGVVDVKMQKGAYNNYNKQISVVNEDGSKTVVEKSWFKRGNMVTFVGFRRGEMFIPKKYNDTILRHTVQRIIDVREDGTEIIFQSERMEN